MHQLLQTNLNHGCYWYVLNYVDEKEAEENPFLKERLAPREANEKRVLERLAYVSNTPIVRRQRNLFWAKPMNWEFGASEALAHCAQNQTSAPRCRQAQPSAYKGRLSF
jgi:hypothetical protein